MSKTFAYAKVRNQEMSEQEVRGLFAGFRVSQNRFYIDGVGEDADAKGHERPAFDRMATQLDAGDLVLIDSMRSLGDSNMEILRAWEEIRHKRHANVKVLDTETMDTRLRGSDAADENIVDLAMDIFAQATLQSDRIRKQKQAEGIASAKRKGVRFGIARKEIPKDFEKYKQMYLNKEIKGREAADILGMSHSTFFYRVNH